MNELPLSVQITLLALLILCSAFFSGSETSMLSLNKHKLKHLAEDGNKNAKRALELLSRPDRLLGVILLGNNFVNILAASLATIIGLRIWGDAGIFIMTMVLTVLVLIFGEVAPKTFAALHPEKFAFPVSPILKGFLKILSPAVWVINSIAAIILKPLGLKDFTMNEEAVSKEELCSILRQNSQHIDENNQDMMLGVLYLEDIEVEDIMVARHELVGLNLQEDWSTSVEAILKSKYARLLVYDDSIDNVKGILHIRDVLNLYREDKPLSKDNVLSLLYKPYFIPEGTPLRKQLQMFQEQKRQTGIVVDEYGDVIGLLTLEDILEYIVGDLGLQEIAEEHEDIEEFTQRSENEYEVRGSLSVNYLNKELDWSLPSEGPTTLSGLILEELGNFPKVGTTVSVNNYDLMVLSFADNRVTQALVTVKNTDN
ncbi:MAG: HlyC/CorC family transporter [Gammaproteobacteria bacterium]|nr:HlyC/CorC family transporter [Gammaproteobacteria bacterium]